VLLGDGVSEELPLANETERLAWAVLQATNRTQARGSTIRLVIPRAPEVAGELDTEIAVERIVVAEAWLQNRGYLAPANVGLTWGTYTITPAGIDWLGQGMPEPLEASQEDTEPTPDPRLPSVPSGGTGPLAASERVSRWRRMFGG
jgi:hypothetical protein